MLAGKMGPWGSGETRATIQRAERYEKGIIKRMSLGFPACVEVLWCCLTPGQWGVVYGRCSMYVTKWD